MTSVETGVVSAGHSGAKLTIGVGRHNLWVASCRDKSGVGRTPETALLTLGQQLGLKGEEMEAYDLQGAGEVISRLLGVS